jgi:hypothetical protein
MVNIDENFCIKCYKEPIIVRNMCRKCYKIALKLEEIEVKQRGISPQKLTEIQESVLLGSLLGDGWISAGKTSYLQINRSIKDRSYLLWQYEIFKEFCDHEPKETLKYDKKSNKYYSGISLVTRRSEVFKSFRSEWYNQGKIIPANLTINPLIMTVWFCDDGNISKVGKNAYSIKLSTNAFSMDEVHFLKDLLNKRYIPKFRVNKNGSGYVINGATDCVLSIINDIKYSIPISMERKIKCLYNI